MIASSTYNILGRSQRQSYYSLTTIKIKASIITYNPPITIDNLGLLVKGNLMKLRWKYFIILLVVSLIPMAIVTGISQKATKKLGKSLSKETYNLLVQSARREIVSATENYAMITLRAKSTLELALQVLIRESAIALALQPPGPTRG